MKVHLPVFVLGQAADVAEVTALEQRGQVLADGVVDQAAHAVTVAALEHVQAMLQVVAHGLADPCCE
ncbi:hypothetical protein D9M69_583810 [compost metagenome]